MKVIDKCAGPVFIITEEGDRINMKSKLSQLVGFASLIKDGTITIDRLETDSYMDDGIIIRYLLYGEIPK